MKVNLSEISLNHQLIPAGKNSVTFTDSIQPGLSVELRKSKKIGSWRYRYTFNKKQQCLTLGSVKDLDVKTVRDTISKLEQDARSDPRIVFNKYLNGNLTFEIFVSQHYIPYIKTYKRCVSVDLTLLNNHLLPSFGHLIMCEIKPIQIQKFLIDKVEKGYKPGYCNRFLVLLGFCFNLAMKWELIKISKNPVRGIAHLKNTHQQEFFLSQEQASKLITSIETSPNTLLRFFVPLALLTGLRKREILDARWSDINLSEKIWVIPMTKSGRPHHLPLGDDTIQILLDLRNFLKTSPNPILIASEWLFPNEKTGKPFVSIFNAWNSARKRADLNHLRIHDLRHSFASALVNSGVPIYDVQKLLGHRSIRTTERYFHLSVDRLRASASKAAISFAYKSKTIINE